MSELLPQQERFCQEYLIDLRGDLAAKRAGYSEKSAKVIAAQLLKKPEIKKYIELLKKERSEKFEIKADQVLKDVYSAATYDVTEAFTVTGILKPLNILSPELKSAITEVRFDSNGQVKELKFCSKDKNRELLMNHLGLLNKKVELEAGQSLEAMLLAMSGNHEPSGGD